MARTIHLAYIAAALAALATAFGLIPHPIARRRLARWAAAGAGLALALAAGDAAGLALFLVALAAVLALTVEHSGLSWADFGFGWPHIPEPDRTTWREARTVADQSGHPVSPDKIPAREPGE